MIAQHQDFEFESLLAQILCAEDPLILNIKYEGLTTQLSQEHVYVMGPGGQAEYFRGTSAELVAQSHGASPEVIEEIRKTSDLPSILLFTREHPHFEGMKRDGIVNDYPVATLLEDFLLTRAKPMHNIVMFTEGKIIYRSAQEIYERIQRSQGRLDEWPPVVKELQQQSPVDFPHALTNEQVDAINAIIENEAWIDSVIMRQVQIQDGLMHVISIHPQSVEGITWDQKTMESYGVPLVDKIKAEIGIDVLFNALPLPNPANPIISYRQIVPPTLK